MTELTGGLMNINQRCCISTRTTVGPEGSAPYLCVDMEGPPTTTHGYGAVDVLVKESQRIASERF